MADMGQSVENTTLIPLRPQTCSQNVFSGAKGARRFYNVIGAFGVDAPEIADLPPSGVFYTDGFAKRRVAGPGAGACALRPAPCASTSGRGRTPETSTWGTTTPPSPPGRPRATASGPATSASRGYPTRSRGTR